MENRDLNGDLNKMRDELIENDRTIMGLHSTVNKMVLGEMEGGYRRDKFRAGCNGNNKQQQQRRWNSMSSSSL